MWGLMWVLELEAAMEMRIEKEGMAEFLEWALVGYGVSLDEGNQVDDQ